jgi:hypothetical protein
VTSNRVAGRLAEGIIFVDELRNQPPHAISSKRDELTEYTVHQILESLRGLRFGSVNIIVQDGTVIQIDRTEKKRLRPRPNAG